MKFRALTADEVECRVSKVTDEGCSLLLYKDARCDQNILDETVGCMNWQRSHTRDNANCIVSIWDENKNMWVSKEDTGTESYTEKEKGLASDSFKRACFNWGIGRELYTAPFIWIPVGYVNIAKKGDKFTTNDRFRIVSMEVDNGKITQLTIRNTKTRKVVFNFGEPKQNNPCEEAEDKPRDPNLINAEQVGKLKIEMLRTGITEKTLCVNYKIEKLIDMSVSQWENAMETFKRTPNKKA